MTAKPSFASFWAGGSLTPYEQACLQSFVIRNYEISLYTYGSLVGVPAGVQIRDASEVIDERYASAYLIDGKPSLSHFSDIFRYKLFERTSQVWVDTDILLLREFDETLPASILAKEEPASLCGAVLRLDGNDARLTLLLDRCEVLAGKELVWGETGPQLLTSVFGRDQLFRGAFEPKAFFPIHYDDFWKAFLPEHREECDVMCQGSYTAHLWNNIVVKLGVWKELMPPMGSFLQSRFAMDGTERFFKGVYPAEVMRQMVENWRRRYDGADLAAGPLLRQFFPSVRITAEKKFRQFRLKAAVK